MDRERNFLDATNSLDTSLPTVPFALSIAPWSPSTPTMVMLRNDAVEEHVTAKEKTNTTSSRSLISDDGTETTASETTYSGTSALNARSDSDDGYSSLEEGRFVRIERSLPFVQFAPSIESLDGFQSIHAEIFLPRSVRNEVAFVNSENINGERVTASKETNEFIKQPTVATPISQPKATTARPFCLEKASSFRCRSTGVQALQPHRPLPRDLVEIKRTQMGRPRSYSVPKSRPSILVQERISGKSKSENLTRTLAPIDLTVEKTSKNRGSLLRRFSGILHGQESGFVEIENDDDSVLSVPKTPQLCTIEPDQNRRSRRRKVERRRSTGMEEYRPQVATRRNRTLERQHKSARISRQHLQRKNSCRSSRDAESSLPRVPRRRRADTDPPLC